MLRLAVIFESSPFDRKGLFNAVHNRIRHLLATGECEVDAFCIHSRDNAFTRRVRHTPDVPVVEKVDFDGVTYRMLWYRFSITDHIMVNKLHRRPFFFSRFMERNIHLLEGYDCILAHSFAGAVFASEAADRYGIPFFVTWHGSDTHTHPWRNPLILKDTRAMMQEARCNFYVSKALLGASEKILSGVRKEVLYNGVSDVFERYPDDKREQLRKRYAVAPDEKVVAFAGSMSAVKNVGVLQSVFHAIRAGYQGKLKFWMIGDGKLRSGVEKMMNADESIDVRFWGNIPSGDMPAMLNCVDLLLLPSLNEGLGMICAEAVRCGAGVIGSDVGGIPEVIGKDNVVALGDGFAGRMASKSIAMLQTPAVQVLPSELDWSSTAAKELSAIRSVLDSE